MEYGVPDIFEDDADEENSFKQLVIIETVLCPLIQNEVKAPPAKKEIAAIKSQCLDGPDIDTFIEIVL